ncbi:hypothetical protein IWZ01DRAFT_542487 [Phyllosticta capitalensis]
MTGLLFAYRVVAGTESLGRGRKDWIQVLPYLKDDQRPFVVRGIELQYKISLVRRNLALIKLRYKTNRLDHETAIMDIQQLTPTAKYHHFKLGRALIWSFSSSTRIRAKTQHRNCMTTDNACDGLPKKNPECINNMNEIIGSSPLHISERKPGLAGFDQEELDIMEAFVSNKTFDVCPSRKAKTTVPSNHSKATARDHEQLDHEEIIEEMDDSDLDGLWRSIDAEIEKLHDGAIVLNARLRRYKKNLKDDAIRFGIEWEERDMQTAEDIDDAETVTREDCKIPNCSFCNTTFESFHVHEKQTPTQTDTVSTDGVDSPDSESYDLDVEDLDLEGLDDDEADDVINIHLNKKLHLVQAKFAKLALGMDALQNRKG